MHYVHSINTDLPLIRPIRAHPEQVRLIAVAAALVSALFFGLNPVAAKMLFAVGAPAQFDATGLFVARGFWATPLFLLLALITRPRPLPPVTWKAVGVFAICGIAFGPGSNALSALGASATSAAHAVLLLSMFPPLAALLARILLRERLAPLRTFAIMVGVVGAIILTASKSQSGSTLAGDAMVSAFILTWALVTIGIRILDDTYPILFVVGVFGTIGSLLLVGMGAALGRIDAVLIPLHHFDQGTVLCFDVEMVLLLSLLGQLLQGVALRSLNVALVAALTSYGSIAAGLGASIILLGEHLTVAEIIAGIFLVTALGLSLVPLSIVD